MLHATSGVIMSSSAAATQPKATPKTILSLVIDILSCFMLITEYGILFFIVPKNKKLCFRVVLKQETLF